MNTFAEAAKDLRIQKQKKIPRYFRMNQEATSVKPDDYWFAKYCACCPEQ
jgi:hypothetical protein